MCYTSDGGKRIMLINIAASLNIVQRVHGPYTSHLIAKQTTQFYRNKFLLFKEE